MTLPWGTPPEPQTLQPPEGYKLVKIKPLYQRAVFWVPVVAILAVIGMATAQALPKSSTADAATPPSSSVSSTAAVPVVTSTPVASDPLTTAPASATGVIGQPTTVAWSSDDTGTVTVYSAKWVESGADDIVKPQNGAYLVIDVGYVGGTGTVSYNPMYWSLRDADGREYDASLMPLDKYSPQLQSGDLAAGAKARGFVAFDAPQGPFALELAGVLSGTVMTWDLPAK